MKYLTVTMPTIVNEENAIQVKYTPPIDRANWKCCHRVLWYGVQLPQHPLFKRFKARLTRNYLPAYKMMVDICFRIEDGNKDKIKDFVKKYDDIKQVKTTPIHARMFRKHEGRGNHGNKSNQGQHDDKTIRNDS